MTCIDESDYCNVCDKLIKEGQHVRIINKTFVIHESCFKKNRKNIRIDNEPNFISN